MKTIKTALLAGVLATVSTMAFAQAGAPTAGVDFRSVYGASAYADGSVNYVRASKHLRTQAANHQTIRPRETTGSGHRSVSSPD
jgi:hypothetical protein